MARRRRRHRFRRSWFGRNPWPMLVLLLLGLGLALQISNAQKGTQRDPRRELRKF